MGHEAIPEAYETLADRLAAAEGGRRVTAFPDGSVDAYCTAFDGRDAPITDRETFGERIANQPTPSFPVECDSREPGGQAPNAARQLHALGDAPVLFGHLDDPVFDDLPFETASMGSPSRIDVVPLADDDLLFSRTSPDVESWSLEDLATAIDAAPSELRSEGTGPARSGDPAEALSADGICCGNWASIEGLTPAIREFADAPIDGEVFVLDPGPVGTRSRDSVSDLLEALSALERAIDVVYSVNRTELAYTAEAVGEAADDDVGSGAVDRLPATNETDAGSPTDADSRTDADRLASVREAAGIGAVVLHAADEAAVATRDGVMRVENLDVDEPRRRTGAGDRFGAAVAFARLRDWTWRETLALGNCCAAHYVETADTGDPTDLLAFLDERRESN